MIPKGNHKEHKKCIELNGDENTIYQNLRYAAKTVLKRNQVALNTYVRIEGKKKSQINTQSSRFKNLKKGEQNEYKASRMNETIKPRAEISEIENRKSIEKINEIMSWFCGKSNKTDKTLAKHTKKKGMTEFTNMKDGLGIANTGSETSRG